MATPMGPDEGDYRNISLGDDFGAVGARINGKNIQVRPARLHERLVAIYEAELTHLQKGLKEPAKCTESFVTLDPAF
ncbi:MAG TPA: hypothetical protein VN943_05645 [Candidatus Acidoferrum sp.]|nr:hypothetical protein [Candidatus Acidoferrum sp.]